MIAKALVSAGLVAAAMLLGAATAGAQPTPSDPNQNPFGGLSTSGQQAAPAVGGPTLRSDIERGLRHGLGN
jgi:hypothetical protein